MLVSPPEKLLQAGMLVKHGQARGGGGLWVVWIGAAVVGLVLVYNAYKRQQALIAASQQQAIAQGIPATPQSVLHDWQGIFST